MGSLITVKGEFEEGLIKRKRKERGKKSISTIN